LNKIDFIHSTFSVPICEKLEGKGYPNSTLKKIYHREKYDPPISSQLFDFIPLLELARAYFLIGMSAENKSEYYIGSGMPRTLSEHFSLFSSIIDGKNIIKSKKNDNLSSDFNVDLIAKDLGFELKYDFEDIAKKLKNS
jgi:nucleoside-diphosphate-sugar epimerase